MRKIPLENRINTSVIFFLVVFKLKLKIMFTLHLISVNVKWSIEQTQFPSPGPAASTLKELKKKSTSAAQNAILKSKLFQNRH